MRKIIVATKKELQQLIDKEMQLNGSQCDLNHIDVSNITDMCAIFEQSEFNGDISKWNTSNVIDMSEMFTGSQFNGDLSTWDVGNVKSINYIFVLSSFNGDLSDWKPYSLEKLTDAFILTKCPLPYWAKFNNNEDINNAIKKYELKKSLEGDMITNNIYNKKTKI